MLPQQRHGRLWCGGSGNANFTGLRCQLAAFLEQGRQWTFGVGLYAGQRRIGRQRLDVSHTLSIAALRRITAGVDQAYALFSILRRRKCRHYRSQAAGQPTAITKLPSEPAQLRRGRGCQLEHWDGLGKADRNPEQVIKRAMRARQRLASACGAVERKARPAGASAVAHLVLQLVYHAAAQAGDRTA